MNVQHHLDTDFLKMTNSHPLRYLNELNLLTSFSYPIAGKSRTGLKGFFKTARLGVEDTLTLFSRQTLPIDGKGTVKG